MGIVLFVTFGIMIFLYPVMWYAGYRPVILIINSLVANYPTLFDTSTVTFMESFVKKSGKSVASEAVYPLLHESIKPLILSIIDVLTKVGNEKAKREASAAIRKIKGDSAHRKDLLRTIETQW